MEEKTREQLLDFILKKLNPASFISLMGTKWKTEVEKCDAKPWLVVPKVEFDDEEDFAITKIKLGAIFVNFSYFVKFEIAEMSFKQCMLTPQSQILTFLAILELK